ncbi:unnamed protein product [Cochlearia groenlandica]
MHKSSLQSLLRVLSSCPCPEGTRGVVTIAIHGMFGKRFVLFDVENIYKQQAMWFVKHFGGYGEMETRKPREGNNNGNIKCKWYGGFIADKKANTLLAYPITPSRLNPRLEPSVQWLWHNLLNDGLALDATTPVVVAASTAAMFCCVPCSFDCQSFRVFADHIYAQGHSEIVSNTKQRDPEVVEDEDEDDEEEEVEVQEEEEEEEVEAPLPKKAWKKASFLTLSKKIYCI